MVLVGLGQQRIMPMGLYAQDKACHAEEELIARHRDIPMDSKLVTVLQRQAATLMEGMYRISGIPCNCQVRDDRRRLNIYSLIL